MLYTNSEIARFRRVVWSYYKKNGRHALLWRKTRNPYRILVSEVMLQQTQVERVIPYYKAWVKKFPTVEKLAKAPLSSVLKAWQGLGYNRRAKYLHRAAKTLAHVRPTRSNMSVKELERLPGVGAYTARAVMAFAYNTDVVFVETNIRTAVFHHFFQKRNRIIYDKISDTKVADILERFLPTGKAREWYAALMDYGAHLKRSGVRLNASSKGYRKQTPFKGSAREARGALLKTLSRGAKSKSVLVRVLGKHRARELETQLNILISEGMVEKSRKRLGLPK